MCKDDFLIILKNIFTSYDKILLNSKKKFVFVHKDVFFHLKKSVTKPDTAMCEMDIECW